ncbi:hypothetical protein D9M69_415210 [compost metagenome]
MPRRSQPGLELRYIGQSLASRHERSADRNEGGFRRRQPRLGPRPAQAAAQRRRSTAGTPYAPDLVEDRRALQRTPSPIHHPQTQIRRLVASQSTEDLETLSGKRRRAQVTAQRPATGSDVQQQLQLSRRDFGEVLAPGEEADVPRPDQPVGQQRVLQCRNGGLRLVGRQFGGLRLFPFAVGIDPRRQGRRHRQPRYEPSPRKLHAFARYPVTPARTNAGPTNLRSNAGMASAANAPANQTDHKAPQR